MKKFQTSKLWIGLAVVIFGGVCLFLPDNPTKLTSSVAQVEESVQDTIMQDGLNEE